MYIGQNLIISSLQLQRIQSHYKKLDTTVIMQLKHIKLFPSSNKQEQWYRTTDTVVNAAVSSSTTYMHIMAEEMVGAYKYMAAFPKLKAHITQVIVQNNKVLSG